MKRFIQSLLLVAFLIGITAPVWGQSSTQGKEFWVALIPTSAPGNKTDLENNKFDAYIAISAPKKCSVKVENPRTGWSTTVNIPNDNSWVELKTDIHKGKGGDIPIEQWYTQNGSFPANEQALDHGLKVSSTEDVSVFCCIRWEYSMDATNILPVTAVQKDYIVQSYNPKDNDGTKKNNCTILATEDCTVTIELSCATDQGTTGTIVENLLAGKVYHIASATNASLSGTKISSTGKIAVFAGSSCANVPAPKSDRDMLYEQLFPIDYWGENFIVVRSKEKDANRVIITAQNDNTDVTIYGHYDPSNDKANAPHTTLQNYTLTLQAGESYEFEMSIGYTADPRDPEPGKRWDDKRKESLNGVTFVDSTVYISTSCPCAVLSYDVGNSYLRKDAGKETVSFKDPTKKDPQHYGAPAMTWIAPIEQMMNDVVFGVMGTDKTDRHFVNIIVPQAGVNTATMNGRSLSSYFHPVESNPSYYYARITLPKTISGTPNPFYRLHCEEGFTATVYGNGDDESYAYTVGSSTIKRAIKINENNVYEEGTRDTKHKYCLGDFLTFNAQVGTDEITSVDWNFGDGTSEAGGMPQTTHQYTSPGWYDMTASLYGHRACTDENSIPLGTVHFSFRVARQDTAYREPEHKCISLDSMYNGRKLTAEEIADMLANGGNDTTDGPCSDIIYITPVSYGIDTEEYLDTITGEDQATGYNGIVYYASTDVIDTILPPEHSKKCTIYRKYHVKVITCLKMTVTNDPNKQHICPNGTLQIEYTKTKGDIKGAKFVIPNVIEEEVMIDNANTQMGTISLPTESISKPGIYKGQLIVDDEYCAAQKFDIDLTVYYPSDIFLYKFNNVMAVYKKGYGGNVGYDFKGYQWYLNYQAIEGATESVLYLGDSITFEIGDVVYVALTDMNDITIPSCAQTIYSVPDYTAPEQEKAPARKMLIDNKFVIRKGDSTYDIYGQKVK